MVNGALALFAGVLGSLLTLLVTNNLNVPEMNETTSEAADASVIRSDADISAKLLPISDNSPAASNSAGTIDPLAELQSALEQASEERAQLAQVLAQLTFQIETLESDAINQRALDALEGDSQATADQSASAGISDFGDFSQPLNGQDRIDTLVSAGIDLQSAQAVQARQDQYQLARLELFDQAEREGWTDTEQFSDRLAQLNEQRPDLRDELGDDAYDRYLFEAGRSNRVVVASIIPGSEAEIAGLQPGDIVISYANERVFATRDLQSATRAGVRGEPVAISVDRQGQPLFFDIPRGPLGVTLSQDQQNPS